MTDRISVLVHVISFTKQAMLRRCSVPLILCVLLGSGCRPPAVEKTAQFEPNLVYAYQMGERSEQSFDAALDQTTQAVTDLFGTPDEPKIPSIVADDPELGSLVSLENLKLAAGPVGAEGQGLYRKHCATCHGVTGNGRGPTAALLNPYPRDYRLGRFKFKSTPIGVKPLKADMAYLIKNGVAGSSMVKIPELTDKDIDALVDYVIFLSWRGQVERSLLLEASELDFTDPEEPESLYDPSLKLSENEDDVELFEEQEELAADFALEVAESWARAENSVREIPDRDKSLVPDTFEQVLAALASSGDSPIKESVARGKELFLSEKTSCAKCHGKGGLGDGQTNDYDEWTKEWTSKFGLDPKEEAAHVPLIARGALPVRNVSPRNFSEGVFRGGRTPEKLYQRIALGIEGTPMPAASVGPEQIWDIVNFVRSLYVPKPESQSTEGEQAQPETSAQRPVEQADQIASNQ